MQSEKASTPLTAADFQLGLENLYTRINDSMKLQLDTAMKNVVEKIDNIEADVGELRERIAGLESKSNIAAPSPLVQLTLACDEIRERARRAQNILLFGFAELG